jgi:hypothetical protein
MNSYNEVLLLRSLNQVVEQGLPMMTDSLTESQYKLWEDYSKEVIQLATKDTGLQLYVNYLQLILNLSGKKLTPFQRLHYCLKYILEVMKVI